MALATVCRTVFYFRHKLRASLDHQKRNKKLYKNCNGDKKGTKIYFCDNDDENKSETKKNSKRK